MYSFCFQLKTERQRIEDVKRDIEVLSERLKRRENVKKLCNINDNFVLCMIFVFRLMNEYVCCYMCGWFMKKQELKENQTQLIQCEKQKQEAREKVTSTENEMRTLLRQMQHQKQVALQLAQSFFLKA